MLPLPITVRCLECNWIGYDDHLVVTVTGPVAVERCPRCASDIIKNLTAPPPATRTAADEQDEGF